MANERDSNPRAAQVRIEASTVRATSGQRKHDLRIGAQPDYVDGSRLHLNRILIAPLTGAAMRSRAVERRERKPRERAMKSNASVSMRGIITFGHQAQDLFGDLPVERQDAAFLDLAQQVAGRLNVDLTGLVVHMDESAIHAHFQIDSYDAHGNSVSDMVKRQQLVDLQDLTAEVLQRYCPDIERGKRKVERLRAGAAPADVVNKRPSQLRRELAREINGQSYALDGLREEETKLQKRIDKLKAHGEALTEKGAQQLATAERRLAAKQAEIDAAEADLASASQKAQKAAQRAKEVEDRVEAAENRIAPLRADLERREMDMDRQEQWLARGISNLQVATRQAISGKHEQEITPADMPDAPEKFEILRKFAPGGRPTWGWRCRFWSLHYSDSGDPVPERYLPAKVREALSQAFDRVASWARDMTGLEAAKRSEAEGIAAGIVKQAQDAARTAQEREEAAAVASASRIIEDAYQQANEMLSRDKQVQSDRALLDLIKTSLRDVLGQESYDRVAAKVNAVWPTHPDNVNRPVPSPTPTPSGSSFSP